MIIKYFLKNYLLHYLATVVGFVAIFTFLRLGLQLFFRIYNIYRVGILFYLSAIFFIDYKSNPQ